MVQAKAISPKRLVRQWVFTGLTIAVGISGICTAAYGAYLHASQMWTHQVNCPGHLWLTASLQVLYSTVCLLAKFAKIISPKWYFPVGALLLIVQIVGISDVAIARSFINKIHVSSSADSGSPLSMVYMIRDDIERESRIGGCLFINSTVTCSSPRVNDKVKALQSPAGLDGVCMAEEKRRSTTLDKAAVFCSLFPGVLRSWQATLTTALIVLISSFIISAAQVFTSAIIVLF